MLGLRESKRGLGMVLAAVLLLTLFVSPQFGHRTVADDPLPTVQFSSGSYSVGEGGVSASISVSLSAPSVDPVQVTCATTAGGTATAGLDYTTTSGLLTFPALTTTPQTCTVPISDDGLDENDETVNLSLSSPSNATLGTPSSATLTIQDNDGPPSVSFGPAPGPVSEGAGSTSIDVNLSAPSGKTVQVTCAATGGSATAGQDYTGVPQTVSFSPGSTSQTCGVSLVDDGLHEDNETVILGLSSPSGATVGSPSSATLTIQDNDPLTVGFSSGTYSVGEAASPATISVVLNGQSGDPVQVTYATSDGSAEAGQDYTGASATLTIPVGESSGTFNVPILNDAVDEDSETVNLTLSNSVNASLGTSSATLTIQDNDSAGVKVTPTGVQVTEGGATDSYQVALTSEPRQSVRVSINTNSQVNANPQQLNFDQSNWNQSKTVTIRAVDDDLAEGPHSSTISHSVSSSDGKYNGLKPANVNASIQDNDQPEIIVEPTEVMISEPNGSAAFSIRLTSMPSSDVTIGLSTSNQLCSISKNSVVLGSGNWSSGASVSVSAVAASLPDGDHLCVVVTGDAESADEVYDARPVEDVIVRYSGYVQVFLPFALRGWPPRPEAPDLKPIANSDGDDTYTVNWTSVSGADSYVLEEARDGAFAPAVEIYAGPATFYKVTGQVTGRFYYRVKARNTWGDGNWSASQWTDMTWEVEPNNQPSDANGPLVCGVTYRGQFPEKTSPESQFDYYSYDLSSAGEVELWLLDIPDGEDFNLVLRDIDQQVVGYSAWGGSADEHILVSVTAGRYYIQVWHYAGNGSGQGYKLKLACR